MRHATDRIQEASKQGQKNITKISRPANDIIGSELSEALLQPLYAGQTRNLILIRIEDYWNLKDLFGTELTESLQQQVVDRLRACLKRQDCIEQIAEHEFGIVLTTQLEMKVIASIAERIIENCCGLYIVEEECLLVNVALGIATYQTDGSNIFDLVRCARLALRQRFTNDCQPYQFFSKELMCKQKHNIRMGVLLEQALKNNRLVLHYQPLYALEEGIRVIAVEALLRIWDEKQNLISPMSFIHLAEMNGMIIPLGRWVIEESCKQLHCWRKMGHRDVRIAINVSGKQFEDAQFLDYISHSVEKYNLEYSDLEIEITERCLLDNFEESERVLTQLSQKGIRIALDDFGTGYSSFSYLSRFPLDVIKLDRSFLQNVPFDSRSNRIISALMAMAKKLELDVVVEGIETPEQIQFLLEEGCPAGQGFGLSHPCHADSIGRMFTRKQNLG